MAIKFSETNVKLLTNCSLYEVYMSLICYGQRILTLCSARITLNTAEGSRERQRLRHKERQKERQRETHRQTDRQRETERRRSNGWIDGGRERQP